MSHIKQRMKDFHIRKTSDAELTPYYKEAFEGHNINCKVLYDGDVSYYLLLDIPFEFYNSGKFSLDWQSWVDFLAAFDHTITGIQMLWHVRYNARKTILQSI